MYKLLLCWRYLKTRYLAFACIISVMLGVATLIVVNSVMNGFSTKLRTLLHSVLSDVVIEGHSVEGFYDPLGKMKRIRKDPYLDAQIDAMAVTLESFAMVQYGNLNGEVATKLVRVLGIDLESRSRVGGFHEHLASYRDAVEKQKPIPKASFAIPEATRLRYEAFEDDLRRMLELENKRARERVEKKTTVIEPQIDVNPELRKFFEDLEKEKPAAAPIPPPMLPPQVKRLPPGAIVGHLVAHFKYRDPDTGEYKEAQPIALGDHIDLITVTSGRMLKAASDRFIVVDYFKSGMSEYDANCIYVPLEHLQTLRGMDNRATNILIKLKDYHESDKVVKQLAKVLEHDRLGIHTWEEKQGPLLKAIEIEKSILNILLFMIIAVAGFGILAIFSMIVSEKTRDIGILKSLGASSAGIMKIFLSYGLLLGVVGAVLGTILGLTITWNINEVEQVIAAVSGSRVFDGGVYYFDKIPTDVNPMAVLIVNLGAVAIAVVFSIIPALRAAMLHPVQALRYE